MRELKCRAKVKWNGNHFFAGDWVEGFYAYKELTDEHVILVERANMNRPGSYFTEVEVIPETVGQYTPYRDITGENICEGDIVKWLGYEVKLGRQVRPEKTICINDYVKDTYRIFCITDGTGQTVEIIGNIHENPELLEVHP